MECLFWATLRFISPTVHIIFDIRGLLASLIDCLTLSHISRIQFLQIK